MAAFRLTNGTGGCPPTANPTSAYSIPFRFDSNGNLWITGCFQGFKYFGEARHDVTSPVVLGSGSAPVSSASPIESGPSVTAGSFQNVTVTNTTDCTMGFLVGMDMFVQAQVRSVARAKFQIATYVNGTFYTSVFGFTDYNPSVAGYNLQTISTHAGMLDVGVSGGGAPQFTLSPGISAVVSCRFHMTYDINNPDGVDNIQAAGSAVRVYGYIIPS